MRPRTFFWRLFLGNALLLILGVGICAWWIPGAGHSTGTRVWSVGGAGLVVTVALAVGLARLWSRPIAHITAVARSLSRGDLSTRATVSGADEIALLAASLNQVRDDLVQQVQTIDHQRRTLESLLTQLGEGIVVAGPDGRIVLCNQEARELLLPDTAADNGHRDWVGRLVEECIPQLELQQLLLPGGSAAATPGGTAREARVQIRGRSGPVTLMARASDFALPRPAAQPEAEETVAGGRILVLTDITELARAIQMKTDFVANASHELRTPLAVIRASVETLLSLDPTQDPSRAITFLKSLERHTTRLEELVADLLELSRLESAQSPRQRSRVQLAEVFRELAERSAEAVASKQLRWETSMAAGFDGAVMVDPHLLRLTLENLVDNAVAFTGPGGTLRLSARTEADRVNIEVADTGCGIPPEEQERVFERFYQVERGRRGGAPRQRGTGLGLSIVRHAVAAMRGFVRLESQVGVGTRVTVTIPRGYGSPTPRDAGGSPL